MKLILLIFHLLLISNTTHAFCLTQKDSECSCPSMHIEKIDSFRIPGKTNIKKVKKCLPATPIVNIKKCLERLTLAPNSDECEACEKTSHTNNDCFNFMTSTPPTLEVPLIAPKDCGYRWKGFKFNEYKEVVSNFLETHTISCTESMCTSATFLALSAHAKELYAKNKISKEVYQQLTTPGGDAYRLINNTAEPNVLVESFGLGTGSVQYAHQIGTSDIPKAGDFVQIWRENNSGHSVIFQGFLDSNGDGKNDMICYWSSQSSTNGYGNNCERLTTTNRILIGSLHD